MNNKVLVPTTVPVQIIAVTQSRVAGVTAFLHAWAQRWRRLCSPPTGGNCNGRARAMTGATPGDMFVVRNVANLVPPYQHGGSFASVPAALEFAVLSLGVEHIIVLGHAQCGGIHALMRGAGTSGEFIGKWVGIAQRARERVLAELPAKPPALQERACEQGSILVSLENLMTYSWIAERVATGTVHLHGWYFDIAEGELLCYNPARNAFGPVAADSPRPLERIS